jgi:hypothetical protein
MAMRGYWIGLLLAGLLPVAAAADDALPKARAWVQQALGAELRGGGDLNRIASLAFPLATDARATGDAGSRALLGALARHLAGLDVAGLDCAQLPDVVLAGGFVRDAGEAVDVAAAERRLANCQFGSAIFDTANALVFACRYAGWDPVARLPGSLSRLVAAQRADGAFVAENGRASYYLSSHAVLAVHWCGGDPAVVARGAAYLRAGLVPFRDRGFNDGLAESLIFLRWLGAEAPDRESHLAALRARIRPDGGLCFVEQPGCSSHWHATSLLLELLLERGGFAPGAAP